MLRCLLMSAEDHKQALPSGFRLGAYHVSRVLGVGGFGVTYLCEHTGLAVQVAVKEYLPNEIAVRDGMEVHPKSAGDREGFEWGLGRFLDEARTLARFEHPNVVRVRDCFEANNTAYIVMDYEEGEPLDVLLRRRGTLTEAQLRRVLLPVVDGLRQVHAAGFLHRDIKPANIFVRRSDETPVLLDFGSARQALGRRSRSVTAIASAGYSPPEQYESDGAQGAWTDIYALSALCYRAITGDVPMEATRRQSQLLRTQTDPLPKLAEVGREGYSQAFLEAVDRGLRVIEAERPQGLDEWLPRFGEQTPSAPESESAEASRPSPTTAHRKALTVREMVTVVGALIVLGLVWLTLQQYVRQEGSSYERWRAAEGSPSEETEATRERDQAAEQEDAAAPVRLGQGRSGDPFRDCAECPEMVVVPAGSYRMGSANGWWHERPVHEVTIGTPFAVGKYEVTFAQWDACVRDLGCPQGGNIARDRGWGRGKRPVIDVSWNDAQRYVRWLSGKTNKPYRLLSESEWEYAARARTKTAYSWGNGIGVNRANCRGCGSLWDGRQTAPAGSFAPNAWGLHDMHGNVWEWVEDCWNDSYAGSPRNGSAWRSGYCSERVLRGGSWNVIPSDLRAAGRDWYIAGFRVSSIGFRVARTLAP